MLFINIFNSKTISHKGEGNRAGFMFPKPGGVYTFVIPRGGESLPQEFVGQNPRLGKSPHCLLISKKIKPSLAWTSRLNCFTSIQGTIPWDFSYTQKNPRPWWDLFLIEAHIFCTVCAQHAVPKELWRGEVCCLCGCVTFIVDRLPPTTMWIQLG